MTGEAVQTARIARIAGPVVGGVGLENVRLYDVVQVGEIGLVGEVIRLSTDIITIQVYEDTSASGWANRSMPPACPWWRSLDQACWARYMTACSAR